MDTVTKKKRSEIMSRIKSKRTKPEMLIHGLLKGNRVRHKMWPRMYGNPDIFLRDSNTAIFVNGCFWHGCKEHFRVPKSNSDFWREKINRNIKRQKESIRKLKKLGCTVRVVWEHSLKNTDMGKLLVKNGMIA